MHCASVILLNAYLPTTAPKMAEQLGLSDLSYADLANHPAEYHVHKGEALFPRIDVEEGNRVSEGRGREAQGCC